MNNNLLMITGLGSAKSLASGKKGAFYNTLEELHKYWDRIDIIVPRTEAPVFGLFENVHIHVSPWPLIFHPIFFLKKGASLYKKHRHSLMTVHEFPPFYNGIGAFLLWCHTRVPYILEIHHVPGYPKSANIKESIYRFLMSLFIALDAIPARAVRVVNQNQTKKFLLRSGVPARKIIYIPSLYIDEAIFKPEPIVKEFDIIFVGRLEKNKGIDLFIEAARELGIRACIVGDGPEKNRVRRLLKGQHNIIFHGWAKDSKEVAELLNKSRVFILTSFNEGGPRVVVEAMACGVPVVATPVGIVPDLEEACLVADWDKKDFIRHIEDLLRDDKKYKNYSEKGLEVARRFQKVAMIKNYAEELKKLI